MSFGTAFMTGCTETYEVRGRQVVVEADAGLTMCGGTLEHMDRFVERFAAEIGLPLADGPWIEFRWLTPEHFAARNPCGGMPACALIRTVYASEIPHEHELVHSAASDLGLAHPFFVEGLAMAFEGGTRDAKPTDDEPDEAGSEDGEDGEATARPRVLEALRAPYAWLPGEYYMLAGAFTRYLIDRFGLRLHLEFYRRTWYADRYRGLAREFLSVFGVTLEEVVLDFEAERADCHYAGWRFKLLECEAPELAWDDQRLARNFTLDCDDAAAVGVAGVDVRTSHSFTVATPGRFRVELRERDGVRAMLGSCGGCERPALARLRAADGPQELELPAGRYFLRAEAAASDPVTFGVVMERIDE
ncbi:hypothetical protein [Nannocystis sp. SCPEA4]|uniref:hypothetical protein n=1 Tax=Nannocystis sp. SCPEA4 TaxID=2996787 RepID=UPI00226F7E77|nr:hypothetical protein [Nannocystis sp. SCPEA4]MCY1056182.1 hypothetical protein [Nannocystis sp. SCPEA4]